MSKRKKERTKKVRVQVQNEMKVINSMAWSFHRTTGIDLDELRGEAGVAFAEARERLDESRGALSTLAYHRMRARLTDVVRRDVRRHDVFADMDFEYLRDVDDAETRLEAGRIPAAMDDYSTSVTPERITEFRDRLRSSSVDVQTLARLVFRSPQEYLALANRGAKEKIRKTLRKKGWSWPRIWSALHEMRELLG